MAFDLNGARAEGYTDAQIADHLASLHGYNISGAREEGYDDTQIAEHLAEKSTTLAKAKNVIAEGISPKSVMDSDASELSTQPSRTPSLRDPIQTDANGRITTTGDRATDISVNNIIAKHGVNIKGSGDDMAETSRFLQGNTNTSPRIKDVQAAERETTILPEQSMSKAADGISQYGQKYVDGRSLADTYADFGKDFMSGVAGVSTATGQAEKLIGLEKIGQALVDEGDSAQNYWSSLKSDYGKEAERRKFIRSGDFSSFGNAINTLTSGNYEMGDANMATVAGQAIQSAPGMVAMGGVGKLVSAGLIKSGALNWAANLLTRAGASAPLAEKVANYVADGISFGGSEGVFSGLQNAAQTGVEIRDMSFDKLKQSPVFNQHLAEQNPDLPEAERMKLARAAVADDAEALILKRTILTTGGISALTGGGVLGVLNRGNGTVLGRTVSGFTNEGLLQELPQSGIEQYWQNIGKQLADPTQDLSEGVAEQAIQGGVVGGVMGLAGGGGVANEQQVEPYPNAQPGSLSSAANIAAKQGITPKTALDDAIPGDEILGTTNTQPAFAGITTPLAQSAGVAAVSPTEQTAPPISPSQDQSNGSINAASPAGLDIQTVPAVNNQPAGSDVSGVPGDSGVANSGGNVLPAESMSNTGQDQSVLSGSDATIAQKTPLQNTQEIPEKATANPVNTAASGFDENQNIAESIKPAVEQLIKLRKNAGQLRLAANLDVAIQKAKVAMKSGTGKASDFAKAAKPFKGKDDQIHATLMSIANALEPATPATKKPQKTSTDLLQRIKQLGGIDAGSALDITGEPRGVGAWKFAFRKSGTSLDDLATQLAADGFNIDTSDVDGGVQQLRDMIREHINGERNFKATTQEAAAESQAHDADMLDMVKQAEALGIKVTRSTSYEHLADLVYEEEDNRRMAAIDQHEQLGDEGAEVFADIAELDDEGINIPFGDEIKTDRASADAYFGYEAKNGENQEGSNRQADGVAGRRTQEGSAGNARTGEAAPGSEILKSHTNAEVLAREEAARNAQQAEDQAATQRAVEHERNQPLSLEAQTQERTEGSQGQMFTPDGRASAAAAQTKKLEVLKAQAQGKITGDQGAALKELADAGEHAAVDEVLKPAHVDRGSIGASLTKEQKKSVLKTLVDVYKTKGAEKESKGLDRNGNERTGYAYQPELFEKSDITGAMVRYYVTLPDGRIAHPTELFPEYTQSDIDAEMIRRKNAERNARLDVQRDYARPEAQFTDKISAAKYWDEKSEESKSRSVGGWATVHSSLDRDFLTNGEKFIMVPGGAMKNGDIVEALAAEGWIAAKPSQPAQAEQPASGESGKIDDLGEKIGGARKDTSVSRGGRVTKESTETAENDATWRKRFEAVQMNEQVGQPWLILDKKTHRFVKTGYRDHEFSTKEAAEKVIPLAAVALKHRVVMTSRGDEIPAYEIWRDVTDRKRISVVSEKFASREDAMKYMAEHAAEIIETKTSFGEEILPKPETVQRIGEVRRKGDVGGKDFMDTFGFRGVEFGNWNNQEERQDVLNHAYDGLLDLAEVLNIPPKAISLNGDLALAFGARGQGLSGARAHYERNRAAINLTKMSGAGALAHEWLHSLDHYLGRADRGKTEMTVGADGHKTFGDTSQSDFASHGFAYNSKLRAELRDAYKELIETMFYKAEKYVEDTQKAEEWLGRSRDALQDKLNAIRKNLSEQRNPEYYKRNNKPASAEQLARFDELAEKLIDGQDLGVSAHFDETKRVAGRINTSMRMSNETLEAMNAIIKNVRGRSGFNASREGWLDSIRSPMSHYQERIKMMEEARTAQEKIKRVPTDYRKDAKEIDQGRASDYWATEHEMAARAFSSYVEDKLAEKGNRSDFLSYGSKGRVPAGAFGWVRPFPAGDERVAINKAFDNLFKTFQTKETDKGVALHSRGEQTGGQTVESVTKATQTLRNNWIGFRKINIIQSVKEVPNDIYLRALRALKPIDQTSEGVYDPKTNTVYLIADNITTLERAVWVAVHEVVGHGGVRMLGAPVVEALDFAGKNMYVQKLAKAIAADRNETFSAKEHTDEAIAELAAATITGNTDAILERYGVKVPAGMRSNLLGMVKRVIEAVRNFMAKVLGKPVESVSDGEIVGLLRQMRDAVEGKDQAGAQGESGLAMASTSGTRGKQSPESFARMAIEELAAENDSVFAYKKTSSNSIDGAILDVVDGAEFMGEDTRQDERTESHADRRYSFKTANGKPFYVYETDAGEVWVDVSRLETGSGGGAIYAAIGNYAFNTGKRFIGDPFGLSPEAVIRRTHHMLSSALRFGTTRHLDAAKQQVWGMPEDGVEPLDWRGSDIDKVEAMIHTIIKTAEEIAPSIKDFHYDFQSSQFKDKTGTVVSGADIARLVQERDGGNAEDLGIGTKTARRVTVLRSLLAADSKGASGGRSGILEQLLQWSDSSIPENLEGLFSRSSRKDVLHGDRAEGARVEQQGATTLNSRAPAQQSTTDTAARSTGMPSDSALIADFRNDIPLKRHADYKAAKAGDIEAAVRLASDLVKPESIAAAKAKFGDDVAYLPVMAQEASGKNQIPNALANHYAEQAGGELATGIFQTNKAYHTGADAMERMIARSEFGGEVVKGQKYVLVDDVSTMGGTLADLASYIQSKGGKVIGSVVLTNASRSGSITPDAKLIRSLEDRHGQAIRELFGVEPSALTRDEAQYLIGFRTTDELRNRAATASTERSRRILSKAQSEAQDSQAPVGAAPLASRAPTQSAKLSAQQNQYGELTSEQARAISEVVGQPKTYLERAKEFSQDWQKNMVQGIVDQYAPIKELNMTAYIKARMTKGSASTLEAIFMYGKPRIDENGDITGDFSKENGGKNGFASVLAPLDGEHDRFLLWVAALRADRLKSIGLENLWSAANITELKKLNLGKLQNGNDRMAAYAKALKGMMEYNDAVLKIASERGLINDATRKMYQDTPYVPFYRLSEEDVVSGFAAQAGMVNQTAWKKLKGGTQKLNEDLLANLLQNWSHLIEASARNDAAKATLIAAVKVGAATEVPNGSPGKSTVSFRDNVTRTIPKGKEYEEGGVSNISDGTAKIEENTERTFIVSDPHLMDAITSIGNTLHVPKVMKQFKHMLTMSVTANPAFKLRNLIRDSVQSMALGELSYNPVKNINEGRKLVHFNSETRAKMLFGGGIIRFGSMLDGNSADMARELVNSGVPHDHILDNDSKIKGMWDHYIKPAFDAYQEFGDRGEQVNRAALFAILTKPVSEGGKGMTQGEANYWARDLMDFSMSGKWQAIRFLTQTVPFMNARLQGLYKLGKSAKADKARFGYVVGGVAMASLMLLAAYGGDDDWKKREDWDRDNYWWFKIGGHAFRIPKPFEIGAIGTLAERSAELMFDKEMTGSRFRERLGNIISQQLSMNPTPQLVKPMIDLWANKDSFSGRSIETMGMEKLKPEDRSSQNTSGAAKLLGQLGMPNPAQAMMGNYDPLSPVQIDFLIKGYFSWLGMSATTMLDYGIFNHIGDKGEAPAMKLKDVFFVGNFVESLPSNSSRYVTQMYDQAKEIEHAYNSYADAAKHGDSARADAILKSDMGKIMQYPAVEKIKAAEGAINNQIKIITNDKKLNGDEKRTRIDKLNQQKEEIAKLLTAR